MAINLEVFFMNNFNILNLQKKKNPKIYGYRESFVTALKNRLNNESLNITVDLINFEDTRANVLIDDTIVGMIVSYYENIEMPEDIILYFIPNLSFFNFIQRNEIEHFINLSNQFMRAYVETINLDYPNPEQRSGHKNLGDFHFPKNEIIDKTFDDFDIDLSSSKTRYFSGHFMDKPISFIENSRFIFNLIKEEDSFKLIDDFKMSIKNRGQSMFAIIGVSQASLHQNNRMFSVSLEKRDNLYKINHDYHQPLHNISFKSTENIPDMAAFVSIICYYSIMKTINIEIPSFEDFLGNKSKYQKLIEMTVF